MRIFSFIMFCFVFSCMASHAQEQPLSSTDKRAIKEYHEGLKYYNMGQEKNALSSFLKAVDEDPKFIEAHSMLGYVYEDMGKDSEAIIELRTAIEINPEFYSSLYFTLGKLELNAGNYEDAERDFTKFMGTSAGNDFQHWYAGNGIASCKFAKDALKHPVPFSPKNLGRGVNTPLNEYFPAITADGKTMMFTRLLPDEESMEGSQEDIYISHKSDDIWGEAYNIGPPLNTPHYYEGAPSLSADGRLLIYASSRPDNLGSCDLYYSYWDGSSWTAGINLGRPVNTEKWESQPSLSPDGKTLYFIRAQREGDGETQDIFVTELNDSGYWSKPQKLSDTINTPGREETPFIAADNQTLFFCSDGHPGMGGTDIFISRRLPNGRWGIPKNLGYPINSSKSETGVIVDPDGQTAYFASNRPGGYGGLDLYSFLLYDSVRPARVTYMKGKVYDVTCKCPLQATFNLIDLATGKTILKSNSLKKDGSYFVSIPVNKSYALNVSKKGYLFYSENFSLNNIPASAIHPFIKDVPMQRVDTGASIILNNIFFETNKYDLKSESEVELNKLISFMQLNPTIKIQISGHTDNVGSHESNMFLSENRAKAVFDYLIAHSIAPERITYKGYGETKPIATNDTDAGRAQNRRTEMKITGK